MRVSTMAAAAGFMLQLAGGPALAQIANCPVGTYQWTDGWGNPTCRSFSSQQDVVTGVNPATGVPNGAMPSVDPWGNPTARGTSSTAESTYYDTSGGCPVGTYQWVDSWGNPTCKRF